MERLPTTPSDKTWLQENQPDLSFDSNKQIISGKLRFKMYYSVHERGYVLNPDSSYENKSGIIIEDVYDIEIDLSKQGFLPLVHETGGRILRSKEKWDVKQLIDMHIFPDGTLCLCIKTEERLKMPNGFKLKDFFEKLLIPFFYYQSFFEQYGKEPWKGYSHGDLGFLESYLRQRNPSPELTRMYFDNLSKELRKSLINRIRFKGHESCICQSKRKFRKCHREAFLGYNKLRSDFIRLI